MSNQIPEIAKAHQEIATRNAHAAVDAVAELRRQYDKRITSMEHLLNTLATKLALLEQKYNLLLSERFNGRSTTEG